MRKDRTAAERQRRYRERRKQKSLVHVPGESAVTAVTSRVTPTVTPVTTSPFEVLPPRTPVASRVAAVALGIVALAIAGVALLLNANFGASLGRTSYAAALFAALAVTNDLLATLLPSVGRGLWVSRPVAAVTTWAIWGVSDGRDGERRLCRPEHRRGNGFACGDPDRGQQRSCRRRPACC